MPRIHNKIALITGASRGIGYESAKLLAKEGAKVILTDIRQSEGEALARELDGEFLYLDVADESQWQQVHDTVLSLYGRIDVLFNNAGIIGLEEGMGPQDPEHASLESWHRVHHVNLDGVFLGCKYGIALMKQHGGSIINMSSRSGIVGIPGAAAYASSKAAIRNHTKTVALYCAQMKYQIRCNSVHPAAILTPMWDAMLGADEETRRAMIEQISSGIPMGHMGTPLDVANTVLFLASEESKYITGSEFTIDGGILAGASAPPQKKE